MSCPAAWASGPSWPHPVTRPKINRGLRSRHSSGPAPILSITPGRNPSKSTSAFSTRRSKVSTSRGLLKSRVTALRPRSRTCSRQTSAGRGDQRVVGSPSFPASDAELRPAVERSVDYAPYDPAGIARQMAAIVAAAPRHDRLKALKIPALVIHGGEDPLIPVSGGEDTARSIPGAELLVVPGMGHDFPELLVPVYLRAIVDFVAKVEARTRVSRVPGMFGSLEVKVLYPT